MRSPNEERPGVAHPGPPSSRTSRSQAASRRDGTAPCAPGDPLELQSANERRALNFPGLAPWWPELVEIDRGVDPLEVARGRRHLAELTAWENRPVDPEEDVAGLLDGYSTLLADHREECARIAADPVYVVARVAGEKWRRELLGVAGRGGFDPDAAREWFDDRICECELKGHVEFVDGSLIRQRHRDADRCRWCRLLDGLDEQRWAATLRAAGHSERDVCASAGVGGRS